MSDKPKTLICCVGIPRSGKSTWACQQGHPMVCPDAIRLGLHGQRHQPLAEPFVWATAKLMVRALFLAGHNIVILDATNTTKARRAEWRSKDWTLQFQEFQTSLDTCKAWAIESGQPDMLPVIDRMHKQYQPVDPSEVQ